MVALSGRDPLYTRCDDAPNFHCLTVFWRYIWVRGVCCFEFYSAASIEKVFDRKLTINNCHYNLAMARLDGFIDNEHVTIENPSILHRFAAYTNEESGLWVLDQLARQVEWLRFMVLCR